MADYTVYFMWHSLDVNSGHSGNEVIILKDWGYICPTDIFKSFFFLLRFDWLSLESHS